MTPATPGRLVRVMAGEWLPEDHWFGPRLTRVVFYEHVIHFYPEFYDAPVFSLCIGPGVPEDEAHRIADAYMRVLNAGRIQDNDAMRPGDTRGRIQDNDAMRPGDTRGRIQE